MTVGVLAFRGVEEASQRWTSTTDYLSAVVPAHTFTLLPLSLEAVPGAIRTRRIDFLITNPGNYVALAPRFGLTKIATLKTDGFNGVATRNQFGAVIFVRADSDIATLADLKGRTLAAVAPDAFGGFQMAWREFKDQGIDPFRDLAAIKFMGFPQDAIVEAVLSGAVDAGTLRTGMLEASLAATGRDFSDIRVLHARHEPGFDLRLSTRLYPEWVFAATAETSLDLREQVALALLAMLPESEAARTGRYAGWTTPHSDQPVIELFHSIGVLPGSASGAPWGWIAFAAGCGLVTGMILIALWHRMRRRRDTDTVVAADLSALTPRERAVLALLVAGQSNKRIAHDLGISEKTVEYHRANMMRKLHARNTAMLVRTAVLAGVRPATSSPSGNP